MNKNEMLERLDALEKEAAEMRKKLNEPEISKEQRFLELLNGCTIKIDKEEYPNSVFYVKGGKIFFEIEKTKFWTDSAKELFKECVTRVMVTCSDDIDCDDNNNRTIDTGPYKSLKRIRY